MKLQQLASRPNLELAWRRITTGTNLQYKTLYRNLYYVYEVAIEANLRDLRDRILGGTFDRKFQNESTYPSLRDYIVQSLCFTLRTRLSYRRLRIWRQRRRRKSVNQYN